MILIVDGTVVFLDIRHQVVDQVLTEHVATKTGLWSTVSSRRCQQFGGITIRQHDNHLLGSLLCQQIVEDIVHTTHLIINLFGISSTTNQIEYRVFLITTHHVVGWQIHDGGIGAAQTLRVIMDILHGAMGHILDVVGQSVFRFDLQQTVLKALVGEVLWVVGVHDAHTVNHEAIGIHVGGSRTQCHGP